MFLLALICIGGYAYKLYRDYEVNQIKETYNELLDRSNARNNDNTNQ